MKCKSRYDYMSEGFFKLNRELLLNPLCSDITYEEIILYTVLDDRMRMSCKNPEFEDEKGTFIFFKQSEIAELLHTPKRTIREWFKKLENHNLIFTQKRGLGLAQKIYLRDIGDYIREKESLFNDGTEQNEPEQNPAALTGDMSPVRVPACNQSDLQHADTPYIELDLLDTDLHEEYKENNTKESLMPADDERKPELQANSISKKMPKKRRTSVFKKPTIEELQAYGNEIGFLGFDAERFFDYYERNGWVAAGNKIKNWKAAVRTWKRNSDKWQNQRNAEQEQKKQAELKQAQSIELFEKRMEEERERRARQIARGEQK